MLVYVICYDQLFNADERVLKLVDLNGVATCNVPKIIPAVDFCKFGVHHSRQKYAKDIPFMTMDDVMVLAANYARNEEARQTGNVPLCWQIASDADLVRPCLDTV